MVSADNQAVTLEFTNHYIRHLSAYVEFYDENDVPIENPDLNCCDTIITAPPETATIKFLTLINPVSTFMSIPVFPGCRTNHLHHAERGEVRQALRRRAGPRG